MKRLFALVAFLHAFHSQAACDLTINAGDVAHNWNMNFRTIAVNFTVTKTTDDPCDYGIGFSNGGAASYSTRKVVGPANQTYQLYKDAGLRILKDLPDITSAHDVIVGSFPAGINLVHNLVYYIDLPASSMFAVAGTYTDTFTLNAYEGANPALFAAPTIGTDNVTLTVTVDPFLDIALTSRGGTFDAIKDRDVNFGLILGKQIQGLDLVVKSNTEYTIEFTSAGSGKLKKGNSAVPYFFYVGGTEYVLNPTASLPPILTPTEQTGRAYPIDIAINPAAPLTAVAGEHTDTISVDVTTPN